MMLTELFPQFLKIVEVSKEQEGDGPWSRMGLGPFYDLVPVETLDEADGIRFTDPRWAESNPGQDGREIGESIYVAFAGHDPKGLISRGTDGQPTAWAVTGTGYADLRLMPSIFSYPNGNPPGWHGFIGQIVSGEVTGA
jgi:hypothetical protein